MIKLYDSQIIDILPAHFKNNADVQALSSTLKIMNRKLLDYSEKIGIYYAIDNLDEAILDFLAIQMRTQYYDTNFSIKIKRELIKNTLKWYRQAGTPAAIEELVSVVFGKGVIKEWFEYNGEPNFFRVEMTNMEVNAEKNKEFKKLLNIIKRASSHLDSILYNFEDGFQNIVLYEKSLNIKNEFHPRSNIPYLMYDGTAKYNGIYRYNKYKSSERIELYPIQLKMKSEIKPQIIFLPEIRMKNIFKAPIYTETKLIYKKDIPTQSKFETKLKIKKETVIMPKYKINLKIGKHLTKYNSAARYDGTKQYYVEKEEII